MKTLPYVCPNCEATASITFTSVKMVKGTPTLSINCNDCKAPLTIYLDDCFDNEVDDAYICEIHAEKRFVPVFQFVK